MNKERISAWLKKYRSKMICAVIIIAVLIIAFFMGDSRDNVKTVNSSGNVNISSEGELQQKNKEFNKFLQENNSSANSPAVNSNEESDSISNEDGVENQETDSYQVTSDNGETENITTGFVQNHDNNKVQEQPTEPQNVNSEPQSVQQSDSQQYIETTETRQPSSDADISHDNDTTTEKLTCTFSISCAAILDNMDKLDKDKKGLVPSDGWILEPVTLEFTQGETVFDVLKRVCIGKKIHMESSWTPLYNSAYIEGINNLYQFDCGKLSGWMYCVNGVYNQYGCSKTIIKNGDVIKWVYTCDLGKDVQK